MSKTYILQKEEREPEFMQQDNWVWTDELVKDVSEYIALRVNTKIDFREQMKYLIQDFKQSHTPKPQAENKPDWEIVAFIVNEENIYKKREDGHFRQDGYEEGQGYGERDFHYPNEKIHSVKRQDGKIITVGNKYKQGTVKSMRIGGKDDKYMYACTGSNTWPINALEDEPQPQKEESKDWEIVQLKGRHGKNFIYDKKGDMWLNEYDCGWPVSDNDPEGTGCDVHAVKRLKDGVTFTVCDTISTYFKGGDGFSAKIHHFTYTSGVNIIDVYFEKMSGAFNIAHWLKNAQKVSFKPQQQRIEVSIVEKVGIGITDVHYDLRLSNSTIPKEKHAAIKQAIEQVLNDDTISERFKKAWEEFTVKYPEIKDKQIRDAIELLVNNEYVVEKTDVAKHSIRWFHKYFTQQQVDAMREDAFKAGRLVKGNPAAHIQDWHLTADNVQQLKLRYKTFEDYKQSKQWVL